MARSASICFVALALACAVSVQGAATRSLLQASQNPNGGVTVTVTADKPNVDAIAITPVLPYPQSAYYCNVTGDSRIPAAGAVFPLTVRVPVGVAAKVIFANITGTIPGTNGSNSACSSVVQQPGSSVVQQPGSSVVQQPGSSVVQQPGSSVVQQPGSSVVQQPGSSVVQQPGSSVVQQPGSSVVQQPGTQVNCQTSVVQQPGTSVVQQPGTSVVQQPGTSVVQQPGTSVVQQPGSSVVQQPGTTSASATSVVQQPGTPGVGSSVVQQPTGTTSIVQQQQGRRLLQAPAPVEFISNNGSTGQPQLNVLDTVEGVPNIVFTPTAAGQTASFNGALQVAVTTTGDGFGTPFIPYRVESRLSPDCRLAVRFVAV